MKKPSSAAYADALEAAANMALDEMDALLGKLDLDKPVECKQVLLVAIPALVDKYGAMAAAAAAESYARERESLLGGNYTPLVAPPIDHGAIRAKVRYALRYLFGEEEDGDRPREEGV